MHFFLSLYYMHAFCLVRCTFFPLLLLPRSLTPCLLHPAPITYIGRGGDVLVALSSALSPCASTVVEIRVEKSSHCLSRVHVHTYLARYCKPSAGRCSLGYAFGWCELVETGTPEQFNIHK